ncbi:UNVERIFIED_ORG: hypothetical protein FHR35_004546 [Microbispora rosea subsp. rosea]
MATRLNAPSASTPIGPISSSRISVPPGVQQGRPSAW